MSKYIFLCLLCLSALLSAQVSPYGDLIQSSRSVLASQPADIKTRLSLAYYLMLNGETTDALRNYETVLLQDPLNVDAAAGILWAHNTLGEWRSTLQSSKEFIHKMPDHAPLYSFRAYALAQKGYQASALHNYNQALSKNPTIDLSNSAHTGKGWAYLALGDYPAAKRSFRKAETPLYPDAAAASALAKANLRLDLNAATNYDSTYVYGLKLSLRQRRLKTSLSYEQLHVDGRLFRSFYQGEIAYQFAPAQLSLKLAYLDGEDSRIYPGRIGSVGIQTKLYLGSVVIDPKVSQHVGLYERLNLYQTDLGVSVLLHPWYVNYNYSYLYQDTDFAEGDSLGAVHSLHLGYQFPNRMHLGLYATMGDLAWWTSPYGVIMDDFEPVDSYYGISLSAPLFRHVGILLYHQVGIAGEELRQLSSVNVSYNL